VQPNNPPTRRRFGHGFDRFAVNNNNKIGTLKRVDYSRRTQYRYCGSWRILTDVGFKL